MRSDNHEQARKTAMRQFSRRRLLQAGVSATMLGIAGCAGIGGPGGGSGNGNGENGAAGPNAKPVDPEFTSFANSTTPDDTHFNPFNPDNPFGGNNYVTTMLWDGLFRVNAKTGKRRMELLTDFVVDGTTATLTFNPDYTWTNGDPVKAIDFVAQLKLSKLAGYPIWEFLKNVTAADKQTVELSLTGEINPDLLKDSVNGNLFGQLCIKHSEYKQWIDRVDDASSQKKRDTILSELQKWEYAPTEQGKPPVTNGPYKLKRTAETEFLLERHEDYPVKTNVSEYKFSALGEQRFAAMISGKLDGAAMLVPEDPVAEQFPTSVKKIRIPDVSGLDLGIQHDHELLGNRKVRQAFAYAIDRKQVLQNSPGRLKVVENTSGMVNKVSKQWLGENANKLVDYGLTSKPKKAAAAMREAGYQKKGGKWVDSGGKLLSFEILTPPWPSPQPLARTVAEQLTQFGIEVNPRITESTNWSNRLDKGDYVMTSDYYGGSHPYMVYEGEFLTDIAESANRPTKAKVPPVGNPGGQMKTVDLTKLLPDLRTAGKKKTKNLALQLAWYYNQVLPEIPISSGTIWAYMSTENWELPPLDDDVMYYYPAPNVTLFRFAEDGSNNALIQGKSK